MEIAKPPPRAISTSSSVRCLTFPVRMTYCLRIGLVIGIGGIGVERRHVLLTGIEVVERERHRTSVLVRHAAHEPLARVFGLARHDDVVARFGQQVAALFPVQCDVLDETDASMYFT